MQIDFHHAATYVIARLAEFPHRDAALVAQAAQYVDDATNSGVIAFDNEAMYSRIASAHKMLDYKNLETLANHQVWIPFHFLPGNGGLRPGMNPAGTFVDKIICRPDSHVARDMVRACIAGRDRAYGLHRLGITMHVFADTWAHQGFAGINHDVNLVRDVSDDVGNRDPGFAGRVKDFFGDIFDDAASQFVGGALPLGHGAALSYPDRPWLQWRYVDGRGDAVVRDNPTDFLRAAERMCQEMRRYRLGDPDAEVPGLPEGPRAAVDAMLRGTRDEDGEARHRAWLARIAAGDFGFPGVRLQYRAKGAGSWKHEAVGTTRKRDRKNDRFPYHASFLESDWKHFHDALQAHRFAVLHDILPRYGICAA